MRRAVLFAILCLMVLSGTAHAVQLEEGWYAWFGNVYLEGIDGDTMEPYYAFWYPTSALDASGPVTVGEREWFSASRYVTVSETVSMAPGVFFEDAGTYQGLNRIYSSVHMTWQTDYDGNRMRLQVLRRRAGWEELLWEQTASGPQTSDGRSIWETSALYPGDEVVFRVVAIPEPMSIVTLACGMSALCWQMRRRRR